MDRKEITYRMVRDPLKDPRRADNVYIINKNGKTVKVVCDSPLWKLMDKLADTLRSIKLWMNMV